MKILIWTLLLRAHLAHPEVVLKQAVLETGSFKSQLCIKHHNLFGIKKNGRYASFRSYKSCISYYAKHVSTRYKGGNYYHFLRRIHYASDVRYTAKLRVINTNL